MEEIGGKTEQEREGCMKNKCCKEQHLYSYFYQLIESNVCSVPVCSLLKIWETIQVLCYIYLYLEVKFRRGIIKEETYYAFFSTRALMFGTYSSTIFFIVLGVIYIITLIVLCGYLLDVLTSYSQSKFMNRVYRAVAILACILLLLLTSAIALPVLTILLFAFNCDMAMAVNYPITACWDITHIVLAVINAIVLCVLLIIYVVAALFLYDDFYHSKFPYSGPQSYCRLISVIDKIAVAAGVVFDYNGNSATVWFAIVLAAHCAQMYLHITQPPMWNSTFHNVIIFCDGIPIPFLMFFFANNWIFNIDPAKLEIVIVICLSLVAAVIFILIKDYINGQCLGVKTDQIKSAESMLSYLYMLILLYIQRKESDSSKLNLVGVLSAFQESCKDEECRCKQYDLAQVLKRNQYKAGAGNPSEEKVLLNSQGEELIRSKEDLYAKIIHEILKSAHRQFPRNMDLTLIESYFLKDVLNNPYKSAYELAAATNLRPNLLKNFAIYRYKRLIEHDIKVDFNRNDSTMMSVDCVVEMERIYYLFRKLMSETANTIIEFLNCIREENLNGEKMEAQASKIGLQNSEIADMYQSFIKTYPFYYRILADYGRYLQLVLNSEPEANQLFTRAQDIVKRTREERSASTNEVNLMDPSRNHKVAVLVVSANAGKVGTILNCNNEVFTCFGYEPKKLVNLNINSLLPEYFVRSHTQLIENYLNEHKGLAESIGNNCLRLCQNARGYLIPCKIQYHFYPKLDRGLLFVVFVQLIEQVSSFLPVKGNIKENDIGFITCGQDGSLLGISESVEKLFRISLKVINSNKKADSSIQKKINIEDIVVNKTLLELRSFKGIGKVEITNAKVMNIADDEDVVLDVENTKEAGETRGAMAIVEGKVYPNLTIYQIIVVACTDQNQKAKVKKAKENNKEIFDDNINAEVESTNTSSSCNSQKKYVPLIKNIKESIKNHESSKVKVMTRVGYALAAVLFALNTAVMIITTDSISLTRDRVILIDSSWDRVVELGNLHMYLNTMMSISLGLETNSIHSYIKDNDRFDKVKQMYTDTLENLRLVHNSIDKMQTSFSEELRHYSEDQVLAVYELGIKGSMTKDIVTFMSGITELTVKGLEFTKYTQSDMISAVGECDFTKFQNKSLNVQQRNYFYILYNTLNSHRNMSVAFAEIMGVYSTLAADQQLTGIVIFSVISMILILLAGILMICIITNIKSTRLLVLAFYAETPHDILQQMAEGTDTFIKEIENYDKEINILGGERSVESSLIHENLKSKAKKNEKEESKLQGNLNTKEHNDQKEAKDSAGADKKEQKMDESRIELIAMLDKKNEKNPEDVIEEDDKENIDDNTLEKKNEEESTPGKNVDAFSTAKLNNIVRTKFISSIRGQRWHIACLISIFLLLFGVYVIFNVAMYWESKDASKDSFSYMSTYLSLHSSLAFSMVLYSNFLISKRVERTFDHEDALLYYSDKAKMRLLSEIELKKNEDSKLISSVVKLQNYLDTPEGVCNTYAEGDRTKESICNNDFNTLTRIGLTNIISRTLDEIATQYKKFLGNPTNFDFSDSTARYVDLLRVKEEYVNNVNKMLRRLLSYELSSYFDMLNVVTKSVYSCWVVIMVIVYFLSIQYFSDSLNSDIIRSNNILNMLPMDYLLAIVKEKNGITLIKKIFL